MIAPPLRTSTTWTSSIPSASEATEGGRGLAVEGAAALLEQRSFGQRRIAILLEQLPLDLGHRRGARGVPALLREHLVVAIEVVKIGRGSDAELLDQGSRQLDPLGDVVAVLAEHPGARRRRRRERAGSRSGG